LAFAVVDIEGDEVVAMDETGAVELGGGAVGEEKAVAAFARNSIWEGAEESFFQSVRVRLFGGVDADLIE
jgi:hypothetical protein